MTLRALALALLCLVAASACTQDAVVGRTLAPLGEGRAEPRWTRTLGGLEQNQLARVILAPDGDVIAVGSSRGPTDFAAGPAVLPPDVAVDAGDGQPLFVARFAAADGALRWGADAEPDASIQYVRAAADADGNVYVSAQSVAGGAAEMFVTKLDPSGAVAWRASLGLASAAVPGGLAVTTTGDVLVTGVFLGTIDLGSGPIACADPGTSTLIDGSRGDAFLARLDATGAWQWGRTFSGPGLQMLGRLIDLPGGDLAVGGLSIGGAAAFGGAVITGATGTRPVLARFTAAGAHVWSQEIAPVLGEDANVHELTLDGAGDLAVVGHETTAGSAAAMTYLAVYVYDRDGAVIAADAAAAPNLMFAATAPNGLIATFATNPDQLTREATLAVRDRELAPLGASAFVSEPDLDPSAIDAPSLRAVATDGVTIAIGGTLRWGVDLGLGVLWPHGSGPVDALSSYGAGLDGVIAVYDWIED